MAAIICILFIPAAFWGVNRLKQWGIWEKRSAKVIYTAGILLIFPAGGFLMFSYGYHWLKVFRYFTIMYSLLLLALLDWRDKIVPNRWLAVLMGIRLLFLTGDVIAYPLQWTAILLSSGIGFLGGSFLFLAASVFSKKGIGMGDVKLIGVMGFYLGFQVLMSSLVITLSITVLFSLFMLLTKKMSLKSEIPFVPFLAVGTITTLLMGF